MRKLFALQRIYGDPVADKEDPKHEQMFADETWTAFRDSGMLWFVNRLLHIFGWAIYCTMDNEGRALCATPARCRFRGFDPASEDEGFAKITHAMKRDIDRLLRDVDDKS